MFVTAGPPRDAQTDAARRARWTSALVALAVALGAFLATWGPITDGDIYWHLAAGRDIFATGRLPRVDAFTVSAAGRPWVDVHWLFQLGAFVVYAASGFSGLAVAKAVLVAGGAVVLVQASAGAGPWARNACAAALLGGLLLARHLLPMRPTIVTLFLLAIFLVVLERMRTRSAGWRTWIWLPVLQGVWCNSQGLAPLGLALVGCYWLSAWLSSRGFARWPFERATPPTVRPFTVLLLACVGASLVSPYGLAAAVLPVRLLARITPRGGNLFSQVIAENIPPFVLERTAPELVWHFKWVLLGLAAAFVVLRPRFVLAHLLALVGMLALALMANRNLPLFYWLAAPLVAIALAPAVARLAERCARPARLGPIGRAGFLVLLSAELVSALLLSLREPAPGSPSPFHFPVESTRLLAARDIRGPVFAADQHGGYLRFHVPALQPYLDTRLVLHTAEEYQSYLEILRRPEGFSALDARVGFRAVVLPTAHPDRYLGLIWQLAQSREWRLAHTDGYEVLFLRSGPTLDLGERTAVAAILAAHAVRFGAGTRLASAARLHLARLLVVLGQPVRALEVLAGLDSAAAARLRARAHFVAGEHRAAETLARILLAGNPRDVHSLVLLAEVAFTDGRAEQGTQWLRRALAIAPFDAEAQSLAERVLARAAPAAGP